MNLPLDFWLIARRLGFDAKELRKLGEAEARKLVKKEYKRRLTKNSASALLRLAKDGKRLGSDPYDEEYTHTQEFIRTALYWLVKPIFKSGTLADVWRDAHDDKIILRVESVITGMPNPTPQTVLPVIVDEETELTF